MKSPLILIAALCIALMAFGCKPMSSSPEVTFGVDAVSASIAGSDLAVTMTHHGSANQGRDGWQFQAFIDADNSAATGLAGADYVVNGVEAPTVAGYAVHAYDAHLAQWGPAITRAGHDDGQTLNVKVSLGLIPPTSATSTVRLVAFLRGTQVYTNTVSVSAAPVARN